MSISGTSAPDEAPAVDFAEVESAAARLKGRAHTTPVGVSSSFDAVTGARCFFKCETFQRTGAFKFRGAYNACALLKEHAPPPGVLTYSSGNHGQAIALACRLLDLPAIVVMPSDAPPLKRAATEGYGAEIITYDRAETSREQVANQLSSERGTPIIPPYDHPDVIAGQGTVAKEFLEEVPELDLLLVPCGGGGLLSGSAIAARALQPSCNVIGVEPAAADDATRSFKTGILHTIENPQTIADGARTPSLGHYTFPIVRSLVDDMVTVPDEALLETMRFLHERMKLVVEPTGVLGAAALLTGAVKAEGKRVGIVLSGGNGGWTTPAFS